MASGRMVESRSNGTAMSGFLAEPPGQGTFPGLIVVHEWWGLNDHIKDVTGRFAAEGFVSLALDLYNGKVATDPGEAGRLMQSLDQPTALKTVDVAIEYLKDQSTVAGDRIGITGFCMGGTFALVVPCKNPSIKAAAPFYGDVPSEDVLKGLSAPILFIGADQDQWITMEKMNRLKDMLAKLGKKGEVKIYEGMQHAFFNDTRPDVYNKEAATDAWNRVLKFFRENL
jgi:carboxymethylenebutenolidase